MGKEKKEKPEAMNVTTDNLQLDIMRDNPGDRNKFLERQAERLNLYREKLSMKELTEKFGKFSKEELITRLEWEREKQEFGQLLMYMRNTYFGLTQPEFAERLNISRSHIINIEAGRTACSSKVRNRIIHVYKVKFGMEKEDLQDALYYVKNPNAPKDIDPAQLKRMYEAVRLAEENRPEETKKSKISKKSKELLENLEYIDVEPGISDNPGGYQWVEPLQKNRAKFVIDPPVTDKNGYEYKNLMSYYYEKGDEESEIARYGDCLIINPDKKYGEKDELFLFEDVTNKLRFIGRLYVTVINNRPEAVATKIHSYRYIASNPKTPIEETVEGSCNCIGQIVHIKRDLNIYPLNFLDEK